MARIIIADPDPASRNALFLWLAYKQGVEDIIQVSDGAELACALAESIPDVIMMDWALPDRPAPEFIRGIREKHPELRWIIMSVDSEIALQAAGCSDWFIRKGSSPEGMFSVIKKILDR